MVAPPGGKLLRPERHTGENWTGKTVGNGPETVRFLAGAGRGSRSSHPIDRRKSKFGKEKVKER